MRRLVIFALLVGLKLTMGYPKNRIRRSNTDDMLMDRFINGKRDVEGEASDPNVLPDTPIDPEESGSVQSDQESDEASVEPSSEKSDPVESTEDKDSTGKEGEAENSQPEPPNPPVEDTTEAEPVSSSDDDDSNSNEKIPATNENTVAPTSSATDTEVVLTTEATENPIDETVPPSDQKTSDAPLVTDSAAPEESTTAAPTNAPGLTKAKVETDVTTEPVTVGNLPDKSVDPEATSSGSMEDKSEEKGESDETPQPGPQEKNTSDEQVGTLSTPQPVPIDELLGTEIPLQPGSLERTSEEQGGGDSTLPPGLLGGQPGEQLPTPATGDEKNPPPVVENPFGLGNDESRIIKPIPPNTDCDTTNEFKGISDKNNLIGMKVKCITNLTITIRKNDKGKIEAEKTGITYAPTDGKKLSPAQVEGTDPVKSNENIESSGQVLYNKLRMPIAANRPTPKCDPALMPLCTATEK